MSEPSKTVAYEAPLNERIRTYLRLEFLFNKFAHTQNDDSQHGMRLLLHTLIDILTLLSKSDYKAELIKELTEQHSALSKLAARDGVNPASLARVLEDLESALNAMQSLSTQLVGSALRDNEFLLSVQNRFTLPGGTCSFDAPALHHWLHRPPKSVHRDISAWFADLEPFGQAICLYLRLLRQSTEGRSVVASSGMYVENPDIPYLLVRTVVSANLDAYPEISAGRHRFSIRFMQIKDINQASRQVAVDIPFMLQCCAL